MTPVDSLTGEPGHRRDVEQRDLARGDARPAARRTVPPFGQKVGKSLLPDRDDLLRASSSSPSRRTRERLLPQLAEPLERAGHALAGDGIDLGAVDAGGRQAIDRLSPSWRRRGASAGRSRSLVRHLGRSSSSGASRPRRPPPRRRGSRSPRRGGSAPGSGGSGRTGRSRAGASPARWARTSSVTSSPMPPLFMYSSPLKSRTTTPAPPSAAWRVAGHQVGLAGRRHVAGDAQDRRRPGCGRGRWWSRSCGVSFDDLHEVRQAGDPEDLPVVLGQADAPGPPGRRGAPRPAAGRRARCRCC